MKKLVALALMALIPALASAQTHKGISLQLYILKPNGQPMNQNQLSVRSRVLSTNDCVLLDETHSNVDIVNGYMRLAVGQGTRGGSDKGISLVEALSNANPKAGLDSVSGSVGNCNVNPAAQEARKLKVTFTIGSDPIEANFTVRSSAYAVVADEAATLNGKSASEFLTRNNAKNLSQSRLEEFFQVITAEPNKSVKFNGTSFESYDPATSGNSTPIDWNSITGKPTLFSPSAHNHYYSDLQNKAGDYLTYQPNAVECTSGEFLKYQQGTGWICGTVEQGGVTSVNSKTGSVSLSASDIPITAINGVTGAEVQSALSSLKDQINAATSATPDLSAYLKKDGSVAMTGTLDLGQHGIKGVGMMTDYDNKNSINALGRTLYDTTGGASLVWQNRVLFDSNGFVSVQWESKQLSNSAAVMLDWATSGQLNVRTNRLTNVANPSSAQDAVTLFYLNTQLANKAGLSHNHSTDDVTSGILPISRGGTGASLSEGGKLISTNALGTALTTISCLSSEILGFNSDGTYKCTLPAASGVSSVSSGNNYITVTNPGSTPVITANVGTSANTLAAGNDSRFGNATKIQGKDVSNIAPTEGQVMVFNSVQQAWQPQELPNQDAPVGTVIAYLSSNCPSGYIAADGSTFLPQMYPALASLLGTTFGGTASAPKLPNLKGVFLRGAGSQTIGGKTYTATYGVSQNDATAKNGLSAVSSDSGHTHGTATGNQGSGVSSEAARALNTSGGGTGTGYANITTTINSTDSETRPANVAINYCIKASNTVTVKTSDRTIRVAFGGASTFGTNCTASACTIQSQSMTEAGALVASVERVAVGYYRVYFSNAFSGIPSCTGGGLSNGNNATQPWFISPISKTYADVVLRSTAGVNIDGEINMTCTGPI